MNIISPDGKQLEFRAMVYWYMISHSFYRIFIVDATVTVLIYLFSNN